MAVLSDKPYTFDRVIRLALGVGLLWGMVWLLGYLSDVLIPFAVALLLAYLIHPLVLLVQRRVPHHSLAVFISLLLILVAAGLLGLLVIPVIARQVSEVGAVFSGFFNNSEVAARAREVLPSSIWDVVQKFLAREDIQHLFRTEKFWAMVEGAVRKVLPGIWGVITGTTSFLMGVVGLFIIFLYLIFLLLDYRKVKEGWKDLLPVEYRDQVVGFLRDFDQAMNRYFRAQAAVASIVGVLFAIGFWLVGLPMGILFGLFVGLLNMVPYLQTLSYPLALILALVHALETGMNIWVMFGLTSVVYVVVQLFQDTFLVPRIMGKTTGLSPAIILLSLSIWGKLLGMLGLLIALPMTALLAAYYQRFIIGDREPGR